MSGYRKIAVAIDLSSESNTILQRAVDVAAADGEIHLIYVQEYGPVFVGMDEVEENLRSELRQKLDDIGQRFDIPESGRHFLNGTPAREIHAFAVDKGVDLIVLGTHGQKGVQLLLGATANSVLHGAPCDVLAVRVAESG